MSESLLFIHGMAIRDLKIPRFRRMGTGRTPCFSIFGNYKSSLYPVTWPFLRGRPGYGLRVIYRTCTPKTGILRSLLCIAFHVGRV